MNPNWALIFQFTVGLLTVIAAIYATRVSRKGKQADNEQLAKAQEATAEQADRAQRFAELTASLASARQDLDYYKNELKVAREERKVSEEDKVIVKKAAEEERVRLQNEWISRFEGLLERCQLLADQLNVLLDNTDIPADQKMKISRAIGTMERHIREDHRYFGADGKPNAHPAPFVFPEEK